MVIGRPWTAREGSEGSLCVKQWIDLGCGENPPVGCGTYLECIMAAAQNDTIANDKGEAGVCPSPVIKMQPLPSPTPTPSPRRLDSRHRRRVQRRHQQVVQRAQPSRSHVAARPHQPGRHRRCLRLSGKKVEDIAREWDPNQDGRITLMEWRQSIRASKLLNASEGACPSPQCSPVVGKAIVPPRALGEGGFHPLLARECHDHESGSAASPARELLFAASERRSL